MPFLCDDAPFETKAAPVRLTAPAAAPSFERTPLVVSVMGAKRERQGRSTVVVIQGYGYRDPTTGREVWVPPAFLTDYASVPRVARALVPSFGRHAPATVLHDWLYAIGEPGQRKAADDIFLSALKEAEVEEPRRSTMYQSVRLFGQGGYDRAARDWPTTFVQWRTGDTLTPPAPREAFFGPEGQALARRLGQRPPENCSAAAPPRVA